MSETEHLRKWRPRWTSDLWASPSLGRGRVRNPGQSGCTHHETCSMSKCTKNYSTISKLISDWSVCPAPFFLWLPKRWKQPHGCLCFCWKESHLNFPPCLIWETPPPHTHWLWTSCLGKGSLLLKFLFPGRKHDFTRSSEMPSVFLLMVERRLWLQAAQPPFGTGRSEL